MRIGYKICILWRSTLMRIVYIVDDDDTTRNYLRAVLSIDQLICRTVESAEAFLAQYNPSQPGCLLLDVQMPGMTGLELQGQLNRMGAVIPVLFITGHAEVPMAIEALTHGAFAFLQKPVAADVLLLQVNKALDHDAANRAVLLERERIRERFESLTPRECDILRLIMAGHSNRAMADELQLSLRTIELDRARVMEKTGSSSLAQLVRMAMELRTMAFPRQRRPVH
jgi:two-component system, LuxR family, response regulator FixJ